MDKEIICSLTILSVLVYGDQEPSVIINQGTILGVKIYPESSRVPIDAFLGIPYATPPVGRLRFAPPDKHEGWSRTLSAQQFAPGCLQTHVHRQSASSQTSQPPPLTRQYSEDCLYLNVWVPDNGERNMKLPVVIIFLSEWMNSPPFDLPAQDLAAEGLVVVTVNYRINVFGFLCLGSPEARGNLGLLDQYYSMLWVRENIERFGGDPEKVTLLGHSAGAVSIVYHMISPRTKALFSRAILMSGNMKILWKNADVTKSSRVLVAHLGCYFDSPQDSIQCLREKTTDEILKTFRTQYQVCIKNAEQAGNWSDAMSPTSDTFLPKNDQYLPINPYDALSSGNFHQIPIVTGLTNFEATDSIDQWQDLARQGYHQLRHFLDYTAIPDIMFLYNLSSNPNHKQIKELIKWNYVEQSEQDDAWSLLNGLMALYSDVQYEAPHAKLLSYLAKTTKPLYVYKYQQAGGVDMYGTKLNTTGAAHTSDLPYLFGPTLYQQLTRRRLSQQEETFSRRLKVMWADIIKFGYPIPPRQYNTWQAYTLTNKHIQVLGTRIADSSPNRVRDASFWNQLLPRLANITYDREGRSALNLSPDVDNSNDTIRHAMYTLLGLVLALTTLLVICLVLLKRSSKESRMTRDFGTF